MTTGPCHACTVAPTRLARRISQIMVSILPAAAIVLLPKCPLCLAGWLTVATGVSLSAAGATWVRGGLVVLWVVAMAPWIWRGGLRCAPALLHWIAAGARQGARILRRSRSQAGNRRPTRDQILYLS